MIRMRLSLLFLTIASVSAIAPVAAQDVVIRNATVMTVANGTQADSDVLVRGGKIVAVGKALPAPAGTREIDARGRVVTPGIVDPHSHISIIDGGSDMASPIQPEMRVLDSLDPDSKQFGYALAGGTTTQLILPGSGGLITGQGVVIKNKVGLPLDQRVVKDAPIAVKFAIGENPVRTFGGRNQSPSSRMGSAVALRERFAAAKASKGNTLADKAMRDLLEGRAYAHIHAYRAGEMEMMMEIAREAGFKIRAFHHATEAFKLGSKLADAGIAAVVWSDWYGVKQEAWDAIPWNATLVAEQGTRVALHSDSADITRRMNQEGAKAVRYGVDRDHALRMLTLDAAWITGLDHRIGSIEPGKDADLVVWNMDPFAAAARADEVLIEGRTYFNRAQADAEVSP